MIDMNKKYQTRDGRKVRILCTDGPDFRAPVVGVVEGDWFITVWPSSGEHTTQEPCQRDLIPAPEEVTLWVNVCRDDIGDFVSSQSVFFTSKDAALRSAELFSRAGYVATVPITFKVPS